MLLRLSRDPFPATISCLHYGNSGPSCEQVCLISEPDGEKVFTGVTFLSLFSKYLSSLLKENQAQSDVPTIILPVPVSILKQLLNFLCTGEAVCKDIEDVFSLGKAAEVLGISNEDWKIETQFKVEGIKNLDRYKNGSQFKSSALCSQVEKEGTSVKPHSHNPDLRIEEAFSLGKYADVKGIFNEDWKIDTEFRGENARLSALNPCLTVFNEGTLPECNVCGKRYTSRGVLIAHYIFKHSQPSPIICKECPICKKTVKYVKKCTDLGEHINQHLKEERKFHCDKCGRSFHTSRSLTRHIKSQHINMD